MSTPRPPPPRPPPPRPPPPRPPAALPLSRARAPRRSYATCEAAEEEWKRNVPSTGDEVMLCIAQGAWAKGR